MNETPDTIRGQILTAKANLATKLTTLDRHVTSSVQSTSSTMEAVQQTFGTLAWTVKSVSQSVNNALNVQRQIAQKPWLFFGEAALLGYVAARCFGGRAKKSKMQQATAVAQLPPTSELSAAPAPQEKPTPIAVTSQRSREVSSWEKLKVETIDAFIGVVPAVASHVVSRLANQVIDDWINSRSERSGSTFAKPEELEPRPWIRSSPSTIALTVNSGEAANPMSTD